MNQRHEKLAYLSVQAQNQVLKAEESRLNCLVSRLTLLALIEFVDFHAQTGTRAMSAAECESSNSLRLFYQQEVAKVRIFLGYCG